MQTMKQLKPTNTLLKLYETDSAICQLQVKYCVQCLTYSR